MKFPAKFPVSKGISQETGAISTASPARQSGLRANIPRGARKGRQQQAFAFGLRSPRLPFRFFGGPHRRKSPAVFENIPVFRRLRPETLVRTPLPGEGGSYDEAREETTLGYGPTCGIGDEP